MKKRLKLILPLAIISLQLCVSCGAPKPEKLIQNGDYVGAVEQLANRLTKKPADQEYADLFMNIYYQTVDQRIPTASVDEIFNEYFPGYSSNPAAVLRNVAGTVGYDTPLTNNNNVMSAINRASKAVTNLNDLVRMQNAVMTMPQTIGNAKKGQVYTVKKYEQNFASLYNRDVRSFGMFYFYMGEALYPGNNLRQRKEILSYYTTANTYTTDIGNLRTHAAEVCYQTAEDYISSSYSIENKNEAINWYNQALKWSSNYKDCQTKIYRANYEIAMTYKASAETISDYETVLKYLNNAGSYKDAENQKKEIAYALAITYKETHTYSDYEKAGTYFKQLGNYENAANEAQLYDFYKRLNSLSKTDKSGIVQLIQGSESNNIMTRTLDSSTDMYTYLNVTTKASDIPVYSVVKDGSIAPGTIIDGSSIVTGNYNVFEYGDRNPLKYNLSAGTTTKWNVVEESVIEKPATRSAHNEVVSAAYDKTRKIAPITTAEYTQIFSDEDLELALGTGYDRNTFTLGRNVNWNNTVYLVKITQKYYKANLDWQSKKMMSYDFFSTTGSNPVKSTNLKTVAPYYIDEVTYGRVGYFVFSTKMIPKDFELNMKDVVSNEARSSTKVNSAIREFESENTTISALSVAEKTWSISTLDKYFAWIKAGAVMDLDVDSLPPISFKIRCLSDNSYGNVIKTGRCKIANPNYVEPVEDNTRFVPTDRIKDINPIDTTRKPIGTVIKPIN